MLPPARWDFFFFFSEARRNNSCRAIRTSCLCTQRGLFDVTWGEEGVTRADEKNHLAKSFKEGKDHEMAGRVFAV